MGWYIWVGGRVGGWVGECVGRSVFVYGWVLLGLWVVALAFLGNKSFCPLYQPALA